MIAIVFSFSSSFLLINLIIINIVFAASILIIFKVSSFFVTFSPA